MIDIRVEVLSHPRVHRHRGSRAATRRTVYVPDVLQIRKWISATRCCMCLPFLLLRAQLAVPAVAAAAGAASSEPKVGGKALAQLEQLSEPNVGGNALA